MCVDVGFAPKSWTPVYQDKNACIEWSVDIIRGSNSAKHVDMPKHFVHEASPTGDTHLIQVSTSKQLADFSPRDFILSPGLP